MALKVGLKWQSLLNLRTPLLLTYFFLFHTPSSWAAAPKLGVVRSQDNAKQWAEITNRLQSAQVDYCIVEASSWKQQPDLGNVSVLLFPNVSTLNQAQVDTLDRWMNRGGKAIVTGPTGNSSQPEVRSQLRSLFGAYWGFPLASPSTLQPVPAQQQWTEPELAATVKGGVVLPSALSSETAAVWQADGKPPAVVVSDKSTFLGWRWGIDAISSPTVDAAWLEAALNRYGTFTESESPPVACNPDKPLTTAAQASRPLDNSQEATPRPLPKPQLPAPSGTPLSSAEASAMRRELEGLIARFESALLSADAANSRLNSLEEVVEQTLNPNLKSFRSELQTAQSPSSQAAHRAATEANQKLQTFLTLVEQRQYDRARQQWLQARQLLWDNYPTDRQLAQPEIRAIWLDRKSIVLARSEAGLAQIFDRLAAAGINTVFFETVNASYPIYPSQVAPQQNPQTQGWDPLEAAVKLAHEREIELHAWVWIFAAANQRHNRILGQPEDYLGPVLSTRPDWAITDKQGRKFHSSSRKAFFDPANPQVKEYLLSLLDEIATRYEVDGIQLDYIRYPFQDPLINRTYGYGAVSRRRFYEQTGADPISLTPIHPLWSEWTNFRTRQIDEFVAAASRQLKKERPELILSTAVFPFPQPERIAKLQQNWEEWAQKEWIDWIVPMTYAPDAQALQQLTQPLFSFPKSSTLLVPSIRLLNLPDVMAVDQVQLLRNLPTEGYSLFAAENLSLGLQTMFSRTQKTTSLLPHRQPFESAIARYQSLQQEWVYLLVNEQFLMTEENLEEWSQQGDRLADALEQLAQPTRENVLEARLALSAFQEQFPDWMEQQSQHQPYQVQAWENRLASLANLLDYGERTAIE